MREGFIIKNYNILNDSLYQKVLKLTLKLKDHYVMPRRISSIDNQKVYSIRKLSDLRKWVAFLSRRIYFRQNEGKVSVRVFKPVYLQFFVSRNKVPFILFLEPRDITGLLKVYKRELSVYDILHEKILFIWFLSFIIKSEKTIARLTVAEFSQSYSRDLYASGDNPMNKEGLKMKLDYPPVKLKRQQSKFLPKSKKPIYILLVSMIVLFGVGSYPMVNEVLLPKDAELLSIDYQKQSLYSDFSENDLLQEHWALIKYAQSIIENEAYTLWSIDRNRTLHLRVLDDEVSDNTYKSLTKVLNLIAVALNHDRKDNADVLKKEIRASFHQIWDKAVLDAITSLADGYPGAKVSSYWDHPQFQYTYLPIEKLINIASHYSGTTLSLNQIAYIHYLINLYGMKTNTDPLAYVVLIIVESNFNAQAIGPTRDQGIMQINPVNFKERGIRDPFDLLQNIRAGTMMLSEYAALWSEIRPNKQIFLAFASYNGGPTGTADAMRPYDRNYKGFRYAQRCISLYNLLN